MTQRFYVVLDVEGPYALTAHDVASWLGILNKQEYDHQVDPTVYGRLGPLVADLEESDGPFAAQEAE